jgi:hypothetical protein
MVSSRTVVMNVEPGGSGAAPFTLVKDAAEWSPDQCEIMTLMSRTAARLRKNTTTGGRGLPGAGATGRLRFTFGATGSP